MLRGICSLIMLTQHFQDSRTCSGFIPLQTLQIGADTLLQKSRK